MKQIFCVLALIATAFAAQLLTVEENLPIENTYIVVFKPESQIPDRHVHMNDLKTAISLDTSFDNEFIAEYIIGDFHGFTARLSQKHLQTQLNAAIVDFIEQDSVVHIAQSCKTQNNAVWGLDRISEEVLNLDGIFTYDSTSGKGIDAYVIDTGILITHTEFGGRAIWGNNTVDKTNSDCNGHGTHVAGTIGGATYGVAKSVNLIAIKVLGCSGSGTNTGVIQGVSIAANRTKKSGNPSIANMSLGGGKSTALDNAVKAAISGGLTFVVAAGNENDDACDGSPSGVSTAISVGATGTASEKQTQVDVRAEFSNYGSCVSLFAPGVLIKSAWIGSNTATQTISGTSMAAPHVAGIGAVYLGANPSSTPASVKSFLVANTVNGVIRLDCTSAGSSSDCNQSPNRMVHLPCPL